MKPRKQYSNFLFRSELNNQYRYASAASAAYAASYAASAAYAASAYAASYAAAYAASAASWKPYVTYEYIYLIYNVADKIKKDNKYD